MTNTTVFFKLAWTKSNEQKIRAETRLVESYLFLFDLDNDIFLLGNSTISVFIQHCFWKKITCIVGKICFE